MSAKLTLFSGSSRTLARELASSIVGFVDLETVGRHRDDLFAQNRPGLVDGTRGHGAAAAALGAGAVRCHGGIALDRCNVVDVGAERVGGQLDNGGLDAVAARAAVHVDVDLAGRLDADRCTLGAEVARSRPPVGSM